jgi:hypothetical protein
MVDVDFTPRLTYYWVKEAAEQMLGPVGPGHYQETNPAVGVDRQWLAEIETRASGQAHVVSDVGGASVTFTFVGENVDVIAWRGPDGGRLGVTLDGHRVDDLPRNGEGQSYVDLFSPVTRWQQRIPLVHQVEHAEHTLQLSVLETPNLASEGNRVAIDAFEVTTGEHPSVSYVLAAALGLAMVVVGAMTFREWRLLRRKKL